MKATLFTFEECDAATGGFAPSRLLGGATYRGVLRGSPVAVTQLPAHACQAAAAGALDADTRLLASLAQASSARHPCLSPLVGVSVSGVDFSAPGRANTRPPCLVHELVASGSLRRALAAHTPRLPPHALVRVVADAASALAALHEAGACHGRVSSSRVFILHAPRRVNGDAARAPVTGRLAGGGLPSEVCVALWLASSPSSSAPSRRLPPEWDVMASRVVTPATDVFALGCVLSELLSPSPLPHEASGWAERDALYRTALADVASRCTADAPEDRPASAEVAAALRRVERALLRARPPPPPRIPLPARLSAAVGAIRRAPATRRPGAPGGGGGGGAAS